MVPSRGGEKNEQPCVGSRSIRDVTVMLKLRHHVMSRCIQDLLEVLSIGF